MQFQVINAMILLLFLESLYEDWGFESNPQIITVGNARSNSTICTTLVSEFKHYDHFLFSSREFCMLDALLLCLI